MKNSIKIYYPVVFDYRFEDYYPFEQKKIAIKEINEIIESSPFELPNWILNYSSRVALVEFDEKELGLNDIMSFPLYELKENRLLFDVNVDVDLDLYCVENNFTQGGKDIKIKDEENVSYLPYFLSSYFIDGFFEILLISSIARPGCLKLRKPRIFINDKELLYGAGNQYEIYSFREVFELRNKYEYPEINFLKITTFYSWIKKNKLLYSYHQESTYGKALNDLSHLNGDADEITRFVYLMRILELIYTKGVTQISDQLNTKIQLYLGEMKNFKKEIKKMYDVRSRFLHGDIPVYPIHHDNDLQEYEQSFDFQIYNAQFFALLLVISTLQKMHLENRLELKFEYNISK